MLSYLLSFILMLFTTLFLNVTYLHYRKWEKKQAEDLGGFAVFACFLLLKAAWNVVAVCLFNWRAKTFPSWTSEGAGQWHSATCIRYCLLLWGKKSTINFRYLLRGGLWLTFSWPILNAWCPIFFHFNITVSAKLIQVTRCVSQHSSVINLLLNTWWKNLSLQANLTQVA